MTERPTPRRHRFAFSVRARITVAVAVLVAVALAGSGLLVWALGRDRVQETVAQAVTQEVAELREFERNGVDPATGRPFTSIDGLVREFLRRNVPAPSEVMLGVWDGAVQVSSASARDGLRRDPRFVSEVVALLDRGGTGVLETRWGTVYYEVLPLRDGRREGGFVVASFVDDELVPLRQTMRSYAVAALTALALVTAVAAWQAGRLLAPVRTLRDAAREVGESDLSRRIPETGNDDLTDLTRTFNAMLRRLEQAFDGQRAFLDDAGHELRTPLTIVRGHLELVDPQDAAEVARTRDLVLDEVDRMSGLVDDLIMLAKTERPDFVRPAVADVEGLVRSVAEKSRVLGDRRWVVECTVRDPVVLDEQRITQALLQLVDNAVKHTGPGDEIAIEAALADGGALRLSVRDEGPGVPDAAKEAIFERFVRADEARDDTGFGLGLAVVSAIATGHGGRVFVRDVRPAEPRGARFTLELPVRREGTTWPAS